MESSNRGGARPGAGRPRVTRGPDDPLRWERVTVCVRAPLRDLVDEVAAARGCSRSALVQRAIRHHLLGSPDAPIPRPARGSAGEDAGPADIAASLVTDAA